MQEDLEALPHAPIVADLDAATGAAQCLGDADEALLVLETTVPYRQTVIDRLVTEGIREDVKVMVGGAPVIPGWADLIGADGYANGAPEAVEVAKKLLGVQS